MIQLSHLYMTTGKTIALTIQTFVGKMMPLLLNMLSRFVIAFLPRSKCLLISWLQSLSTVILEPRKIKCHCFHIFPIYLPRSDGTVCHNLWFFECWVLIGMEGENLKGIYNILNSHLLSCWSFSHYKPIVLSFGSHLWLHMEIPCRALKY